MVKVDLNEGGDKIILSTIGSYSYCLRIKEEDIIYFHGTNAGEGWVMMCDQKLMALTFYAVQIGGIKYPSTCRDHWVDFPDSSSIKYYLEYLEKVYNHLN